MKIKHSIIFKILLIGFLIGSVFSAKLRHKKFKSKHLQEPIRPNVGDIVRNFKHPLYEKEFEPTEVQSLADILPKPKNIYDMADAEIIGEVDKSTELDQKPTMYSTVVTSHQTSIIHPTKPIGKVNVITNSETANMFADPQNEFDRLVPGRFSTPVKISEDSSDNDKFGKMEKPVFIHKGEKIKNTEPKFEPIPNVVVKTGDLDAQQIKDNLSKLKEGEDEKKN